MVMRKTTDRHRLRPTVAQMGSCEILPVVTVNDNNTTNTRRRRNHHDGRQRQRQRQPSTAPTVPRRRHGNHDRVWFLIVSGTEPHRSSSQPPRIIMCTPPVTAAAAAAQPHELHTEEDEVAPILVDEQPQQAWLYFDDSVTIHLSEKQKITTPQENNEDEPLLSLHHPKNHTHDHDTTGIPTLLPHESSSSFLEQWLSSWITLMGGTTLDILWNVLSHEPTTVANKDEDTPMKDRLLITPHGSRTYMNQQLQQQHDEKVCGFVVAASRIQSPPIPLISITLMLVQNDDKEDPSSLDTTSTNDPLLQSCLKRQLVGQTLVSSWTKEQPLTMKSTTTPAASTTATTATCVFHLTIPSTHGSHEERVSYQVDHLVPHPSFCPKSPPTPPSSSSLLPNTLGYYMIMPSTRITLLESSTMTTTPTTPSTITSEKTATNTMVQKQKDQDDNSKYNKKSVTSPATRMLLDTIRAMRRRNSDTSSSGNNGNGSRRPLDVPRSFLLTGPPG
eukprot:scaffold91447_cov35-Attheya_sp.AAC.1